MQAQIHDNMYVMYKENRNNIEKHNIYVSTD